jgi:hypothetical protein
VLVPPCERRGRKKVCSYDASLKKVVKRRHFVGPIVIGGMVVIAFVLHNSALLQRSPEVLRPRPQLRLPLSVPRPLREMSSEGW